MKSGVIGRRVDSPLMALARYLPLKQEVMREMAGGYLLGKTEVSALPFVQPDGSSYRLDRDYAGIARAGKNPSPGPFEALPAGKQSIQVWPASISP